MGKEQEQALLDAFRGMNEKDKVWLLALSKCQSQRKPPETLWIARVPLPGK